MFFFFLIYVASIIFIINMCLCTIVVKIQQKGNNFQLFSFYDFEFGLCFFNLQIFWILSCNISLYTISHKHQYGNVKKYRLLFACFEIINGIFVAFSTIINKKIKTSQIFNSNSICSIKEIFWFIIFLSKVARICALVEVVVLPRQFHFKNWEPHFEVYSEIGNLFSR